MVIVLSISKIKKAPVVEPCIVNKLFMSIKEYFPPGVSGFLYNNNKSGIFCFSCVTSL
jgi:hypothetical protein